MDAQPPLSSRQEYADWVEDRIEDFKSGLTREELLTIAEEAVDGLFSTDDEQYPLTELLLREAVDGLIFQRLGLPTYRQWLRACQNDTAARPDQVTSDDPGSGRQVS